VGDEWNHVERRRQPEGCAMHEIMMDSYNRRFASLEDNYHDIKEKMDEISNRQLEYIKTQTRLEYAISNGMRTDIMVIRERLDTFCAGVDNEIKEIKKRIDILEAFKWFRDVANKFRDTVIWSALKLALAGGLIASIIYFGEKIKNWMVG
jgi:predicted  nucleic acid-binding Zn-ribbon protein